MTAADSRKTATPQLLLPEPLVDDERGFVPIFDNKTLRDWHGDPTYRRVENDCIIGETKADTLLTKDNSFIIWQGGITKDFGLKLQYHFTRSGNSGINYRSEGLTDPKWSTLGYQFDVDGADWGRNALTATLKDMASFGPSIHFCVTGQNYEERARQFLALASQLTYAATEEPARVIGYVGYSTQIEDVASDDWNDVHIIARGNLLIHILNGHVISAVVDDDLKNRRLEGQLACRPMSGLQCKWSSEIYGSKHGLTCKARPRKHCCGSTNVVVPSGV
jgi:Domain of Unknown Function (DUF1080)